MAIFRKVHISFWSDTYVQSLTPEQKFFYLYLLTNERTKTCGVYEISKRQISYDTGYNIDTVSNFIKKLEKDLKIRYSEETQEVAIKNWLKYNENKSPKVQVLVKEDIKKIKDQSLLDFVYSIDTI